MNLVIAFFILFSLGIPDTEIFGAETGVSASLSDITTTRHYVGVRKCALCHSRGGTKTDETQLGEELISTDFVSLTEVSKWTKDKHASAYAALNKGLGFSIIQTLGISNRDSSCLSCHGPVPNPKSGPDLSLGVTCESCHGPGGDWLLPHAEPSWRAKSTREKQQLGMIDLRNPAIKAKQCISCHLGNPAEKKIITHEMYAAGHPPLPSVEIEQHLRRMPAHWRNLSEKNPDIQALLRYDANEKYRTKTVLLGAVFTYREWLNYLSTKSPSKSQHGWTDFAVFDCYSCHHDLKDPKTISWRQQRGFSGVAGRPRLAMWPQALVKLAIFQASGGNTDAYNKKTREFAHKAEQVIVAHYGKVFAAQKAAYSESERHAVTTDLLLWLDRLASEIQGIRFDNKTTVRLMQLLADVDGQDQLDYSSARQIGGALASLFQEAQFSDAKRKEIATAITEIKATVGLEVKALVLVNKWQAAASYEPNRFSKQLSRLAQLLK